MTSLQMKVGSGDIRQGTVEFPFGMAEGFPALMMSTFCMADDLKWYKQALKVSLADSAMEKNVL